MILYSDDSVRSVSQRMRYTQINLYDFSLIVNKQLLGVGSEWILYPRPNGIFTSIWTKNIKTEQAIPLLQDCSTDEGYTYLQGYCAALTNLKIDEINLVFDNSLDIPEPVKRKKVFGIF